MLLALFYFLDLQIKTSVLVLSRKKNVLETIEVPRENLST